jgi:hypothetical protein
MAKPARFHLKKQGALMQIKSSAYRLFLAAAALCLCVLPAQSGVKMFRGVSDTVSYVGGTWDFNNTAKWLNEGSTTQVPWTDSGDIALIVNSPSAWGSATLAVSAIFGAVEASGIIVTNNMPDWTYDVFNGDALAIGKDGVTVFSTNSNSSVKFENPIVLTTNQTWRNANMRPLNSSGTVQLLNVVSSAVGVNTPIVFDGFNRSDPSGNSTSKLRSGFGLYKDNTFIGSTTVSGGAVLTLSFSSSTAGQKIDTASPLILNGGTLFMTGNTATFTQTVSAVVLKTGANNLTADNGKGAFICNSIVRDGVGGTINTAVDWSGGVSYYTSKTNETGILGGWATSMNDGFAYATANGSIGANSGTQRTTLDAWGDNVNIQITGSSTTLMK